MRVLIACEESQVVCKAFRERGHESYSCDVINCSGGHPEWHIKEDVLKILDQRWDLLIAFPPCTYLCVSGARWMYHPKHPNRKQYQDEAVEFFMLMAEAPIEKIAIENPIGIISTRWRKPDQIIKPLMFGHGSTKQTCLWLKNLPNLEATNVVKAEKYVSSSGRVWDKWFFETSLISDLKERSKVRSKTFPGIGEAMAEQWSKNCKELKC